jgi:hypothetical protein
MEPRIVSESLMSPELDAAIRRGLCLSFPKDAEHFRLGRDWHGSRPAYSAVLQEGTEVVGHAGVADRVIDAGGFAVRVAGVLNVFVVPSRRGTGLVHRVMSAAMAEAARRGFDCGLLFCVPELRKVYERTGWIVLPPARITRVDAGREAPLPEGNIAMFFPLGRPDFPPGDIHLRGNDW